MRRLMWFVSFTAWAWVPTLHASERVELTTRVSGVVDQVFVQAGQRVAQGQVLLRLERSIFQAQLDLAEADYARSLAEAVDAEREMGRAQEMFDRGVSSATEFEAAKLRQAKSASATKSAEARRLLAQIDLKDSELKAPTGGIVLKIPGGRGTTVSTGCQPRTLVIFSSENRP